MSSRRKVKPLAPYGITVFCDDIRNEIGGKCSYIGAYNGELLLPEIPSVLPKLGFAVQVVLPRIEESLKLELMIYFPSDELESPSIRFPAKIDGIGADVNAQYGDDDVPPHAKMLQQIILSPVEIKKEGLIKVRAAVNDEVIKCGILRVRKVSIPEMRRIDKEQIENFFHT